MTTYNYGSKKVTANELAKLEIIDRLQWWDYEESDLDPEVIERITKHLERAINSLDSNGNLRNKIWGA